MRWPLTTHAFAVARIPRAAAELADAQKALDAATGEEPSLDAARAKLESDAEQLEKRVQAIRDRPLGTPNGKDSAEREAARWAQARSLVVEARLICDAARLIASGQDDVVGASATWPRQAKRIAEAPRSAPIDLAAHLRADVLDVHICCAERPSMLSGEPTLFVLTFFCSGGAGIPLDDTARRHHHVARRLPWVWKSNEAAAGILHELGGSQRLTWRSRFRSSFTTFGAAHGRGRLAARPSGGSGPAVGRSDPSSVKTELAHADYPDRRSRRSASAGGIMNGSTRRFRGPVNAIGYLEDRAEPTKSVDMSLGPIVHRRRAGTADRHGLKARRRGSSRSSVAQTVDGQNVLRLIRACFDSLFRSFTTKLLTVPLVDDVSRPQNFQSIIRRAEWK